MSEQQRGDDRRVADRRFGWLVSEWRKAWRWASIQISALGGVLVIIYEMLPQAKEYIPQGWFNAVMGICFLAVVFGRLKNQPVKDAK